MKAAQKKSSSDWSRPRVRYELAIRGWSWARIARAYGYTCSTTPADVMRYPYPVMERIVAGIIRVEPAEIWPSRYDSHGRSLHARGQSRAAKQPNSGR